jgi:cephalosporin hydroxylase
LDSAPAWLSNNKDWKHFVGDDISFVMNLSVDEKWPDNSNFHKLDFIFLDTSHEYSHTLAELNMYIPLLNRETGAIALHDTNLTQARTRRLDGGINYGWDNKRGVTRALEDYFNFSFNESSLMSQPIPGSNFLLYHQPWNNGLSILIPRA